MTKYYAVVAAVVVGLVGSADAATPLFGQLQSVVEASYATGHFHDIAARRVQWLTVPGSLGYNIDAIPTSNSGSMLQAHTTSEAHWANDALSGYVTLDFGWSFDILPGVGDEGVAAYLNADNPNWTYQFTATSNGVFDVTYDVIGVGDTVGLGGWNLLANNAIVLALQNNQNPTAGGHFVTSLTAGQTYSFQLKSNMFRASTGVLNGVHGNVTGNFVWKIIEGAVPGAVPEPASWAMFLMGFGIMGAGLRRRGRGLIGVAPPTPRALG